MTELNILILGQTGVGKSTFINALATYITYDSLEEAVSKDLVALIPTEFHQIDSNMRELTIQTGESMNECFVKGKSATKSPRAYVLEHNGCRYRIIDTPGIGDVDGIAVDKQNMQNIMHFAAQYDKIHAICVLLLPNVSRLTEEFQLYFNELFVQFHRSAANNIIFCYTNTSGYMFKPQQTLTQLDLLLKKINTQHRIEIKARDKNRAYSFDNMAYRYCCIKNQYPHFEFSEDEESVYTKSYAISRQESDRMLKFIRTLTPHDSKESMSIFYVRHMIECCTYPLAAIGNAIQKTIAQIDEYKEHVRRFGDNVNELKKMLMTKEEDIAVASRIRNIEENKDKLNKNIRSNEVLKNEIESEQKQIYEACVKGAFFLQTNALTPINDATEGYLTKLIESGKQCGTREKVREYEKMLDNYLKEKNIFYHHISRLPKGVQHIRSDEMLKLLNSLKKMKHYGKDVEAAMNQALKPARIDNQIKKGEEKHKKELQQLEEQFKERENKLEEERKQREKKFRQLEKTVQEDRKKEQEEREARFQKLLEAQSKEKQDELKKEHAEECKRREQQYAKERKRREYEFEQREQQHKQEYEKEHKRLKQEHEEELKRHEQHEQQLKEEVDKYKSADFEKWTILKKDDSINSLLKKIEDKYPGSEMDKLRAEARDKFGIDSDKFNLGITGQSGVGKSTLVNALRGYDDNDPEAATVGITECTDEVKGYPHPKIEHLVLYDLPGAGTRRHRAETYFCDKRLYVFDCLLVVMAVRAFEDDLILAKFAQEKGTPVIFIRNKAKNDFETMQDKNKDMKEEELIELTISTIKKSTKEEIEKVGIKNPNIFIIEGRSLRESSQ
ncbi:hypothetical protein FO519_009225 [Halicephalobus sp. NKZ332]|nr:hypothetical protein FO519_009225 [Halicephalobus sp. NKZ332]